MSKLEITTPTDTTIVVTRRLNAPRQLVFDCLAKPQLVQRWLLGPPGWTMPVCDIDFRVGGKFRYVWRSAEGADMGLSGQYLEIDAPERVAHEELFDQDWTGGRTKVTTVLTETDGRTLLTMTILYATQAARDGAKASGMTEGMEYGYGNLDVLLAELA
jgi:uncharacterized protein YndB with AHSA1/START domain